MPSYTRSALSYLVFIGLVPLANAAHGHDKCSARAQPKDNLQHAIDQLPNDHSPAVLCLGPGVYPLDQFLHIDRDHVHIRGHGRSTIIQFKKNIQQPLIVVGDYANQQPSHLIQDIAIEQMQLLGTTQVEHEFMPEKPYLSNSLVVIRYGKNVRLAKLKAAHCRSACLLSEFNSSDITLADNDVSDATWDGVSFNRSEKIHLIHNRIHNNKAAGMTTEHLVDSEIRGNIIADNGSQGIYLSDSRNNHIVNNRITANKISGILFACSIRYRSPEILCWDNSVSQNNLIESNHFKDNPHAYTIGVDRAANCKAPDFSKNLWKHNQSDTLGLDPPKDQYGECVLNDPPVSH